VYSYLSPSTSAALVSATVVILGCYSSLPLLGIPTSSLIPSGASSGVTSGVTSGTPEVSLLSSCSFLFSHYSDIRAGDAALGFSCLGILIAIKVYNFFYWNFQTFLFKRLLVVFF